MSLGPQPLRNILRKLERLLDRYGQGKDSVEIICFAAKSLGRIWVGIFGAWKAIELTAGVDISPPVAFATVIGAGAFGILAFNALVYASTRLPHLRRRESEGRHTRSGDGLSEEQEDVLDGFLREIESLREAYPTEQHQSPPPQWDGLVKRVENYLREHLGEAAVSTFLEYRFPREDDIRHFVERDRVFFHEAAARENALLEILGRTFTESPTLGEREPSVTIELERDAKGGQSIFLRNNAQYSQFKIKAWLEKGDRLFGIPAGKEFPLFFEWAGTCQTELVTGRSDRARLTSRQLTDSSPPSIKLCFHHCHVGGINETTDESAEWLESEGSPGIIFRVTVSSSADMPGLPVERRYSVTAAGFLEPVKP